MSAASHSREPWALGRSEELSSLVATVETDLGSSRLDICARGPVTTENSQIDARRIVACVNACAGIPLEDLERINALEPYLRLLKLSHLSDRQAATMEGAPPDPYVAIARVTGGPA